MFIYKLLTRPSYRRWPYYRSKRLRNKFYCEIKFIRLCQNIII